LYNLGADGRVLRNSVGGSRSVWWSWNHGTGKRTSFATVQARETDRKLYSSESK